MAWKGLGLETLAPVAMLALAIAVLSGLRSLAEEARAIPAPALAASGASKASFSMLTGSSTPSPAMPAARATRRSIGW